MCSTNPKSKEVAETLHRSKVNPADNALPGSSLIDIEKRTDSWISTVSTSGALDGLTLADKNFINYEDEEPEFSMAGFHSPRESTIYGSSLEDHIPEENDVEEIELEYDELEVNLVENDGYKEENLWQFLYSPYIYVLFDSNPNWCAEVEYEMRTFVRNSMKEVIRMRQSEPGGTGVVNISKHTHEFLFTAIDERIFIQELAKVYRLFIERRGKQHNGFLITTLTSSSNYVSQSIASQIGMWRKNAEQKNAAQTTSN